jgi:hypothetical protein
MTHLLLIELTNEQVAWVAGGFVAAVVTIGTLAAAIKAIRGELWNPFNKGFLAPRRARRLKLLAAADGFDEIVASTKRIEAELKTNGGHSIKDVVNRIDRKVEYLQARTRHQDETNEHATFELNELGNLIFANSVLCDMLNADERATPQIIPGGTLARPKTIPDIKYSQQLSEYYSKGGDRFDQLEAEKNKFFDAKQDSKAYDIINSREYQQVKSAQEVFKRDNPEFAKRYNAEYQQKYGKPPKSEDDQIYDEQKAQFYKIGGARYDQLYKQAQTAYDSGDKTTYYNIKNTREYKAMQASRDQYLIDNPDFAQRYNADNFSKYGTTPKTDADKEYDDLNGQYQNIGGAKYDALYALANQYYDAGNKSAYNAITKSKEYLQAKAARQQFLDDNPEFATRYKAETEAKYGPSKSSSSSSSSSNSSGGSTYSTGSNRSNFSTSRSYSTRKTTASYARSTSSGSSRGTTSKATAAAVSSNSSTPFTNAQKAAYAYARNTLGYSSTQAAGYARKVPATQTSFHTPGSSTSNTTKSVASLPKPTSSSVKVTKTPVDSTKNGTYNQGRTSVPSTLRTVASLPKPVRSSGGGSGGGSKPKKAPSVPIHNFLPGPNTSLVRFNKKALSLMIVSSHNNYGVRQQFHISLRTAQALTRSQPLQ